MLDLDPFLHTPVRQLSLGQRVRGELSAVMLHDPEVLFLDEPTIGLDVVAKERVREFLTRINRERSVTVLLTTHDLADIERLCSRILMIDHGKLIYDGTVDDLIERYGGERTLVVDLEAPAPPLVVPGATVVKVDGPRQWLRFRRGETSAAQVTAAVAAQAPLLDLAIEEPDIEDVVRRIYTSYDARAAPEHHADQHADGVDGDVQRRRMPSAHERLVELVADRVEDAERERRHLPQQRPREQQPQDRVLRHVRALAEQEIPAPEPAGEMRDRRQREDQGRPEDDGQPMRECARGGHADDARFRRT